MKNWLDKYGKEYNANESKASVQEGFVGMGNDISHRNYSPAWGGSFYNGGEIMNVANEENPIAQNGLIVPPDGRRNIHTNNPVITAREEYENQQAEKRKQSELFEYIQRNNEIQKAKSDIYIDPQTGKQIIQNIGIQPTASPIDAAVLGVGALYSGGVGLLGSMANLVNPLPMPNISKLNPWAFKPNPNAYYRGVGKEGIEDALSTGLIKSKDQVQFPSPYFAKPNEFETALYYNPEGIIEANNIKFVNKQAGAVPKNPLYDTYEGNEWQSEALDFLRTSDPNIRLLKKDWLKGYKEIKKPEEVSLYRVQPKEFDPVSTIDKIKQKQKRGEELNWMEDQILNDPEKNAKFTSRGQYHGAWYEKDPNRLDYYLHDKFDETPQILEVKLPKNQVDKYKVTNIPEAQKTSLSPETEFIIPEDIRQGAIKHDISKWEELKKNRKPFASGGVIKDNNGYWNKDNWGKPVEIDSNEITMKGISVPLDGISDTGDYKRMLPGQDYHFKGKRVLELPIKKNGGQLQKLEQLTNFTNLNKPGDWLSKYA